MNILKYTAIIQYKLRFIIQIVQDIQCYIITKNAYTLLYIRGLMIFIYCHIEIFIYLKTYRIVFIDNVTIIHIYIKKIRK